MGVELVEHGNKIDFDHQEIGICNDYLMVFHWNIHHLIDNYLMVFNEILRMEEILHHQKDG